MLPVLFRKSDLDSWMTLDAQMWVYDTRNPRICWANQSAMAFWNATSMEELSQRDFSSDSVNVSDRLSVILRTLEEQDRYADTWTLYPNNQPTHVVLEFRRIEFDGLGDAGLLVKIIEKISVSLDDDGLRMFEATRATSSLITMMSLEGRVLTQNPAALKCYGPPLPSTSDLTDLQARIMSEQDLEKVRAAISQNALLRNDIMVQTLGGSQVHSVTVQRGRDPVTGQPIVLLSEEDVSELSNLYQNQKLQAHRLEQLVAERTDRLQVTKGRIDRALEVAAIWDWDIAKDKLYFSSNFLQLLEYERDEFQQKLRSERFEGIVHPGDYVAYQSVLARFLAHPDQPFSHEMRFVTKKGEYLWVQIEGKCFCDETGKPIRTAGLLTNITQKKKMEARLMASQKLEAIGQLTGGIAHDFNNLLTVILGNVELLQETGTQDNELTSEIIDAVKRGADLTRHLLAFARKQRLNPEQLNIETIAKTMRKTLLRILSETISVVYEGQDDLWDVRADSTQTEAAILNIALNARDAMPNGGIITISAQNVRVDGVTADNDAQLTAGDYVRISISDTGTGMTPEVREKAFDPFFTSKDVGKGSGLGLSMVLGFSQQSGGGAEIASDPGTGTTVSIYLPKSEEQAEKPRLRDAHAPLAGRGQHIHILEDNENVSSTEAKMVESLGYKVSTSVTVAEALTVAENNPDIAAFIVDVILPGGKSGVDFASQVLNARPETRLILVSGYPKEQFTRNIARSHDFTFLPKPFSIAQISKVLADTLSN